MRIAQIAPLHEAVPPRRFCQVSRHQPWLTKAGLAIWPALTVGRMGCGA
jgi:hypothetical protein